MQDDSVEKQSLLPSEERTSLQFQDFTKGYHSHGGGVQPPPLQETESCKGYRALDDILDELGEGKFQRLLLVLMSCGDFVEASEISLHGVLLPLLQEEFNLETPAQLALVGSLTGLGMMLGSSFFAVFSNHYGRRLSFQSSLLCCAVFCLVSSFCNTLEGFAMARCGLGFGYGGNLVASTTLLTEFTPTFIRAKYLNVTNIAYALGAIFAIGLAWGIVPLVGFRWLLRIVSLLAIPVLIALPFCPESPRFLIMKGRHREALQVLERVAKMNKVLLTKVEHLVADDGIIEYSRAFSFSKLRHSWRSTVPLLLVWFFHSFSCGIFGFFPLEVGKLDSGDEDAAYKIAMVFSFGAMLGTLVLYNLTSYFGRLTLLRFGLFATGLLTALIGIPVDSSAYVYCIGFLIAAVAIFPIAMLYLYTPEVHPTETRTLGFGICMLGHRFAPVIAPFVVASLNEISFTLSCIVFGGFFWLAALLSLFLKIETFGRNMVEIDDFAASVGMDLVRSSSEQKIL